jgi:hypothetical protein
MSESDDLRAFIREIMARADRGFVKMDARFAQMDARFAQMDARFARQSAERDRYFELLYEQGERESRRIDDVIAENRAQREALFRILDRLDGNGGTAPA